MSRPFILIPEETIDDLLFLSRTSELDELKSEIERLKRKHECEGKDVLEALVDGETGNTCAHYAAGNGVEHVLDYLITATTNSTPTSISTTSSSAAASIQSSTSLLTRPNTSNSTPLHYASLNGHLSIVKKLVFAIPSGRLRNEYVEFKNIAGRDAAFEAEVAGKEDVVTFLLGVLDEADGIVNGNGEDEDEDEDEGRERAGRGRGDIDLEGLEDEVGEMRMRVGNI